MPIPNVLPVSGKVSAIGMILEGTTGTVPTTGTPNATLGIANTNPERFWAVQPNGGILAVAGITYPAELDGGVQISRAPMTDRKYEGGFSWLADPENLYYPLCLGLMGRDLQATVQASTGSQSPAMYSHTTTPKTGGASFTVEEQIGALATYGRLSCGYFVEEIELTIGDYVVARMKGFALHQTPNSYWNSANAWTDYEFINTYGANSLIPAIMGGDGTKKIATTASPAFVDVASSPFSSAPTGAAGNGPLSWGGLTQGTINNAQGNFANGFISIDGVIQPNAIFRKGARILMRRKIDREVIAGGGFDIGMMCGLEFTCEGTMEFIMQDNTFQRAVQRGSTIGVDFKILGPLSGTSGVNYALELYLPNLHFKDAGGSLVDGPIINGGAFVAKKDATLGYEVQAILTNTVSNAALASGAGSGAGGWSNT